MGVNFLAGIGYLEHFVSTAIDAAASGLSAGASYPTPEVHGPRVPSDNLPLHPLYQSAHPSRDSSWLQSHRRGPCTCLSTTPPTLPFPIRDRVIQGEGNSWGGLHVLFGTKTRYIRWGGIRQSGQESPESHHVNYRDR